MKFLHAADLHVDSPLHGLSRYEGAPEVEIRNATRRALSNLVDLALQEHVDAVFIAGDLYDGNWKDFNTGLFVVNQLRRLSDADIRCFLVAGNHDAASQITRHLQLPRGVRMFSSVKAETVIDEDLGLAVHGRSYPQRDTTEDLAVTYPPAVGGLFNVGLLHTALDGKLGHAPYAPTSIDRLLASNYHYWALGHVHARNIVFDQGPLIVFPGNTQGRHARETGEKGATLVTVDDLRITGHRACSLDVVRWSVVDVDASAKSDVESALSLVEGSLRQIVDAADGRLCAVRVRVAGMSEALSGLWRDSDRLLAEIRSCGNSVNGAWVEKVQLATSPARSFANNELLDLSPALAALESLAGTDVDLISFIEETELYRVLPENAKIKLGLDDPSTLEALRNAAAGRLSAALTPSRPA